MVVIGGGKSQSGEKSESVGSSGSNAVRIRGQKAGPCALQRHKACPLRNCSPTRRVHTVLHFKAVVHLKHSLPAASGSMSRLREEINSYVSVPGALCMVAAGWLYLAANHVNEEARRVSQAYVLDSLSGVRVVSCGCCCSS